MKAFVLSGGAGFGAYQVGAWKALVEIGWTPDIILGISIGSVNAFVISHGATTHEIEDAWLRTPATIHPNGSRRLALPLTRDVGRFRAWTSEMVRQFGERPMRSRLQICMAQVPTGVMRVVEGTQITERHLLAACALPPVMFPVRVDGGIYVDGGVLYHVALKEAVATGADDIVVIDVLRSTPFQAARALRMTTLFLRNLFLRQTEKPPPGAMARVQLRYIGPEEPLGTIRECFEWNPARTKKMIDAGYRETMMAFDAQPVTAGR